jgi:hypothetical protein
MPKGMLNAKEGCSCCQVYVFATVDALFSWAGWLGSPCNHTVTAMQFLQLLDD